MKFYINILVELQGEVETTQRVITIVHNRPLTMKYVKSIVAKRMTLNVLDIQFGDRVQKHFYNLRNLSFDKKVIYINNQYM